MSDFNSHGFSRYAELRHQQTIWHRQRSNRLLQTEDGEDPIFVLRSLRDELRDGAASSDASLRTDASKALDTESSMELPSTAPTPLLQDFAGNRFVAGAAEEGSLREQVFERHTRTDLNSHSSRLRPPSEQVRHRIYVDPFQEQRKTLATHRSWLYAPEFLQQVKESPSQALLSKEICGDDDVLRDALAHMRKSVRHKMMRSMLQAYDLQTQQQYAHAADLSPSTQWQQRDTKDRYPHYHYPDPTWWPDGAPLVDCFEPWLKRRRSIHPHLFFERYIPYSGGETRPLGNACIQEAVSKALQDASLDAFGTDSQDPQGFVQLPPLGHETLLSQGGTETPKGEHLSEPFTWQQEEQSNWPWLFEALAALPRPHTLEDTLNPKIAYFDPIHSFDTCEPDTLGIEYPEWLFVGTCGLFFHQFELLKLFALLRASRMAGIMDLHEFEKTVWGEFGDENGYKAINNAPFNRGHWAQRPASQLPIAEQKSLVEFRAKSRCIKGADKALLCQLYDQPESDSARKRQDIRFRAFITQEKQKRAMFLPSERASFLRLFATMTRLADCIAFLFCLRTILEDPRPSKPHDAPTQLSAETRLIRETLVSALSSYANFSQAIHPLRDMQPEGYRSRD